GALNNAAGANSFAGPITLGSAGTINSTAGTLTLNGALTSNFALTFAGAGNTLVNGAVSGQTVVGGLVEGRITGNGFDETTANPGGLIVNQPLLGEISTTGGNGQPQANHVWGDNQTWIYTGQFFDADGTFSFAENIDDNVLIKIDGVTVLRNT